MKRTNPPEPTARRHPRQPRARQTARALREAFVRVLVERGYEGTTVREITGVAGTGLGTFYDYYANKDDLARVCLNLRSKALLRCFRDAAMQHKGQELARVVDAVVDALLEAHDERPPEWGAHYLIERHFSGHDAYRNMYDRFVSAWVDAIRGASDWPAQAPAREAARVCQTIIYGLFAHAHLRQPQRLDASALRRQACTALIAYLHAAPG